MMCIISAVFLGNMREYTLWNFVKAFQNKNEFSDEEKISISDITVVTESFIYRILENIKIYAKMRYIRCIPPVYRKKLHPTKLTNTFHSGAAMPPQKNNRRISGICPLSAHHCDRPLFLRLTHHPDPNPNLHIFPQ